MSCTPNNYISVIDLTTMEVVKKPDIGRRSDGYDGCFKIIQSSRASFPINSDLLFLNEE